MYIYSLCHFDDKLFFIGNNVIILNVPFVNHWKPRPPLAKLNQNDKRLRWRQRPFHLQVESSNANMSTNSTNGNPSEWTFDMNKEWQKRVTSRNEKSSRTKDNHSIWFQLLIQELCVIDELLIWLIMLDVLNMKHSKWRIIKKNIFIN